MNLEGGYDCECQPRFVFSPRHSSSSSSSASDRDGATNAVAGGATGCVDIDECSLYFNPCGKGRGECINKVGGIGEMMGS